MKQFCPTVADVGTFFDFVLKKSENYIGKYEKNRNMKKEKRKKKKEKKKRKKK